MWKPFVIITVFLMIFLPHKLVYSQTDTFALAFQKAFSENPNLWLSIDFGISTVVAGFICFALNRFWG